MTTYTYRQLEQLWVNAGGPPSVAPLMAAIALAESGGREKVVNSIGACGPWQIHPYQNGCKDGPTNAKMAVEKYRTQGLTAWEAYTNGSYKKFLRGGKAPRATGNPPIQTTGFSGILGSLITPDMLERVGLVIFGGFLIIVGVMMLAGGHTLELVNDASKPKKDGSTSSGIRPQEGGGSVLRNGDGAEKEA